MSGKVMMTLIFFYFLWIRRKRSRMEKSKIEKIIKFFESTGIIAAAVWGLMNVLEKCAEWFENGTLLSVWEFTKAMILFCACLFLVLIFHKFAMFGLHKLWPDVYDEHGHRKKIKQ